jgi:hypothetical protein
MDFFSGRFSVCFFAWDGACFFVPFREAGEVVFFFVAMEDFLSFYGISMNISSENEGIIKN